ncbi:serine/threonine protein phosphatase [Betaproteobacteria bacterium GR16-43]|nr:serine/threonine protein phosphatase [Betaproteobacteria bacterium GR16-43]
MDGIDRREFIKLAGFGGLVFASGLPGCAHLAGPGGGDFHFLQLSDLHWGYNIASVNPDFAGTLPKAIAAVNSLDQKPDFVVFTGDLTQTTDDPKLRRARMQQVREMTSKLNVPKVWYFAGEHDAALDRGEAYQETFGETLRYTFDHKGIHFIVLDNTSDPAPILGEKQLEWLRADLAKLSRDQPIVVLTHRPLFSMYPQWDWATRDGQAAIDLLMPFPNVTVFYGHVHHENHHRTSHIAHHSALSLMFPLAPVGTVEKKTQVPWNAAAPYKGLGYRDVGAGPRREATPLEIPVKA